jgi:aminopeptidase N
MRQYFNTWKFKHPEPNDFLRIMEKVSGQKLGWYMSYWINTTKRIDYGVKSVFANANESFITLERIGEFPMPIDLVVTFTDGTREMYYIPLNETLGGKPVEDKSMQRYDLQAWPWVNPTYTLKVNRKVEEIASVEIDPSQRLADIERKNNKSEMSLGLKPYENSTKKP